MADFVFALSLQLSTAASALGFTSMRIERSRSATSHSRYLRFADRAGRRWVIRVSDHSPGREAGFARPHFDLIAREGEADAAGAAATTWLETVARGEVAWRDPDVARKTRRRRR